MSCRQYLKKKKLDAKTTRKSQTRNINIPNDQANSKLTII